jgi:hypothetical protein
MQLRNTTVAAMAAALILSAPAAMFAQEANFMIRHATNLNTTDTVVNLSDTGSSWGMTFPTNGGAVTGNGNICVNIYVFAPDEQLAWCCMCTLTPNALGSFSMQKDGIGNTLTGEKPSGVVIKLIATALGSVSTASSSGSVTGTPGPPGCDPTQINMGGSGSGANNVLSSGMVAWARGQISPLTPAGTETPFTKAQLSVGELQRVTQQCASNKINGSGRGFCKTPNFPGTQPLDCKQVGL